MYDNIQYQFFMLISMVTITFLKSGYCSLKLIQDQFKGFLDELFLELTVVLCSIWGKLQRGPLSIPNLPEKQKVSNTHII